jgi:hypothetical protein
MPIDENGNEFPGIPLIGDASGNGDINAEDVVEIINFILGNPSKNFDLRNADLNGDGKVNAADVVKLMNIIIGVR